jgi:hypothetical protein
LFEASRYAPAFAALARRARARQARWRSSIPRDFPAGRERDRLAVVERHDLGGSLPMPRFPSSSQRAKRRWARTRSARGRVA